MPPDLELLGFVVRCPNCEKEIQLLANAIVLSVEERNIFVPTDGIKHHTICVQIWGQLPYWKCPKCGTYIQNAILIHSAY